MLLCFPRRDGGTGAGIALERCCAALSRNDLFEGISIARKADRFPLQPAIPDP
jgi:hypothetical protein